MVEAFLPASWISSHLPQLCPNPTTAQKEPASTRYTHLKNIEHEDDRNVVGIGGGVLGKRWTMVVSKL